MKISENFLIQEFVPKAIYEQFGSKSIWFIDKKLITIAEFLRSFLSSPVTINNWHVGGSYSESGYRVPDTTTGGKLSQHKLKSAIDVKVKGITPQDVYKIILANEKRFMEAGITTMENIEATPTWNHIDVRWTGLNNILIVNP